MQGQGISNYSFYKDNCSVVRLAKIPHLINNSSLFISAAKSLRSVVLVQKKTAMKIIAVFENCLITLFQGMDNDSLSLDQRSL